MQRKDHAIVNVMNRLSDRGVLKYRAVCKRWRDAAKACTGAPYTTKAQFVTALSGAYCIDLKYSVAEINSITQAATTKNYYDTTYLNAAWNIYQLSNTSSSHLPCMIYRLSNYNTIVSTPFFSQFCACDNMLTTGRRYNPLNTHNWDVNQAWLLAQIHRGREACLFSPVTPLSIFRRPTHQTVGGAKKHSAFIREIAALIKVGYVPVERDDYIYLVLNKSFIERAAITYDMLTPTKQDVEKTIDIIGQMKRV